MGVWGNLRVHTQVMTGMGQVGDLKFTEKVRERRPEGLTGLGTPSASTLLLLRAQAVFSKELHAIFKGGHSIVCRNYQLKIPCGDRLESQPLAVRWRWRGTLVRQLLFPAKGRRAGAIGQQQPNTVPCRDSEMNAGGQL